MFQKNTKQTALHLTILKLLIGLIFIVNISFVQAQKTSTIGPIPLDPEVKIGKLDNGFTYYIRKNNNPKNKIVMRLVVKAGQFNEDEDQLELAHLTEHMAFEGTKHFPGDSMLNYISTQGLHFGSEFTASTRGLDTNYEITISSGKPELLHNCFQILRDWAQDFTFESQRIDAQRGVVISEKRQRGGNDFSSIMNREINYKLLNNFRYSPVYIKRYEENLSVFKHESLLRFYKDWYIPNNEAVIVVGDIDIDEIEAKIKDMFSDMENPEHSRAIEEKFISRLAGELNGKNQLIKLTHQEQKDIELWIYQKRKGEIYGGGRMIKTIREQTLLTMDELYNKMVALRFKNLNQQYNSPINTVFSKIYRGICSSFSAIDGLITMVRLNDATAIPTVLKTVMTEIERIRQFGFTAEELEIAKKEYLKTFQTIQTKRYSTSEHLAMNYIEHFVYAAAAPSPEYALELVSLLVKDIHLNEMNVYAKEWVEIETNRDIVIKTPERDKTKLPDEKSILKILADIKGAKLQPLKSMVTPDSLLYAKDLPSLPARIRFIESKVKKDTCTTKLVLANGVTVVLRPSTLNPANSSSMNSMGQNSGNVQLVGFSHGGTSLYQGTDRIVAQYAPTIIQHSGVGTFNKFQLEDYLEKKRVEVRLYTDEKSEKLRSTCPPEELETLFQIIYLYFTNPRKDENAFKDWLLNRKANIQRSQNDPVKIFDNIIQEAQGDIQEVLTLKQLDGIRLENAWRIFKERFSDGQDFTFFITGNFDYKKIKKLIIKYLGNLPKGNKKEKPVEEKIYVPTGKISKTLYLGQNNKKADVRLYFPGTTIYNYNTKNNLILDILGKALYFKIMDRLRTDEGGVYSPLAYSFYTRLSKYKGSYCFVVNFDCVPEDIEHLIKSSQEEFLALMGNGPDLVTFQKAVGEISEAVKNRLKRNLTADILMEMYINKENPRDFFEQEKVLNSITWDEVKVAAKQFMTEDNFQRFVRMPESFDPNNKIKQ